MLHKIQAQCEQEGLNVSDEDIVSEAHFTKNALLNVHGTTPFQALTGRSPQLLRDFQKTGSTECSEAAPGRPGDMSRPNRLREIAIQSILEGTSKDRLERALKSKARTAGEALELKPGDLVDFYRTPAWLEWAS